MLAALAGAALAQNPPGYPEPPSWEPTFRLFLAAADASAEDRRVFPDGDSLRFTLDGGTAVALSYEFGPWRRLGFEVGIGLLQLDVDTTLDRQTTLGLVQTSSERVTVLPLTVAVNFHAVQREKLHLYLGPLVGFPVGVEQSFGFSDPASGTFSVELSTGEEPFFGGQIGLDLLFGKAGWGMGLKVQLLDKIVLEGPGLFRTGAELEDSVLLAGVGLVRRF
jgi:hypothetical protein